MHNITLTVFTPTYNRSNNLLKLYNSLKEQTDRDFIWHIVDDGSTDDTKNIVDEFISENKINIIYTYQQNSGKYIAHNNAVKGCTSTLFVCVDSDDWLFPNAVERTKAIWEKVKDVKNICGIASPKKMKDTTGFINTPEYGTLMQLYNKGVFVGEAMLVFKAEILKRFLFPELSGERFMSESVIYNRIDKKYILYYDNYYLYEAEYLEDGLTKNSSSLQFKNPISTLISYNNTAAFQSDFIKAAKAYGCYLAWKKIMCIHKTCITYPVSFIVRFFGSLLYFHYYRLFKKKKNTFEEKQNG